MFLVYELDIREISLVEDDPHDGLPCADRTVYLGMNLVYAYRISFSYKGIKHIFTKLLSLDDHFLAQWMNLFIENRKGIDPIGLLGYSGCYRSRVQSIQACSPHD